MPGTFARTLTQAADHGGGKYPVGSNAAADTSYSTGSGRLSVALSRPKRTVWLSSRTVGASTTAAGAASFRARWPFRVEEVAVTQALAEGRAQTSRLSEDGQADVTAYDVQIITVILRLDPEERHNQAACHAGMRSSRFARSPGEHSGCRTSPMALRHDLRRVTLSSAG
jgi:hypothetical protein